MDGLSPMLENTQRPTEAALTRFALRCVSELSRSHRIETGKPRSDILAALSRHAMTGEQGALADFYSRIRSNGISAEQVVDVYVAAAIDRIGHGWHECELDILQASIALSRLQRLLRELGWAWASDRAGDCNGPCILLILPVGEQHTLGTMVAANQLRRMGVSVKLSLAPRTDKLRRLLRDHRYSAAFVSISNRSCLAPSADLIKTIRDHSEAGMPVVAGGGIVAEMGQNLSSRALAARLGADLATADISEALAFIGGESSRFAAE